MRQLTWLSLVRFGAVVGAAAFIGPGCSDGEQELSKGSTNGGSNTSGGTGGTGGGATVTGTGTTGGGNQNSGIGLECEVDSDCETGLICLRSDSDSLVEGGPAHGFCTFACGGGDASLPEADAECQQFDANSLCQFFSDDRAYCVQLCTLGAQVQKCQGRPDVVCDRVLHLPRVRSACESDADCDINDFCLPDLAECFSTPAVCLPRCNSDGDCPPDRHCNRRYGECVDGEPSDGKPFGESCDPDAAVDECLGFCSQNGACTEKCVVGSYPSCGSEGDPGSAACLFLYDEDSGALGDVGACGHLCDCNDDCPSRLSCVAFEDGGTAFEFLGRPGLCKVAGVSETVLATCETGSGGTTGSGGAGGAAGAAGQGGAE